MMAFPDMVGGPKRFCTQLMKIASGRLVSKSGADGIQAVGLMPDVLRPGSPGVGIFIKISDGDAGGFVGPAVAMEILIQLNVLSSSEIEELAEFGPSIPIFNCRDMEVGQANPNFELNIDPDLN